MSVFVNNKEIENIYLGGKQLDHVYVNGTMVYESTVYIDKPTVTGAYTFNNSTQSAVISGYNSSQMTLEGTTSAKSAGTYTVKFTLKKGYAWKDGSASAVSCTWSIAKRTITIPTLSATSFAWVEGNSHSVIVKNLDTSYVTQTGILSQTDTGSNLNKANTVTWTLKYPSDTKWTDNTSSNKTASWKAAWVDGTSHYKNDLYNRGWNSGKLGYYAPSGVSIDMGSASQPYIFVKYIGSTTSKANVYVKDTTYTLKTVWQYERAKSGENTTAILTKKADTTASLSYKNSEAVSTTQSGIVYGTEPYNSSWDMANFYAGLRTVPTSSNYYKIYRIYYT